MSEFGILEMLFIVALESRFFRNAYSFNWSDIMGATDRTRSQSLTGPGIVSQTIGIVKYLETKANITRLDVD